MATYRIGIGSFNLKDNAVGIGTESTGLGNLKVEGTFKTEDLDVTGVSTFTRYAGFAADNLNINKDTTLTGEHLTTGDIVVGVNSTFTVSVGATVDVGTVPSVSIGTHFSPPTGNINDRPECPVEGTVRFNKDLNTLEFYNGVDWRQFTVNGSSGRGVFSGGETPTRVSTMDYITIASQGNAISFGNLTNSSGVLRDTSACSSSTRGIICTGEDGSTPRIVDIQYFTIQSAGNSIDYGDLTVGTRGSSAVSSSTRGICKNGSTPSYVGTIDSFEISTTGNAIDFGDQATASAGGGGASSPTRGIFGGGYTPTTFAELSYITISSFGNSVKFGELTTARHSPARGIVSNTTRGFIVGGSPSGKAIPIDTINFSTLGNAVDFGNLNTTRAEAPSGCSSSTRGIAAGGATPTMLKSIDYFTLSTSGSAAYFGDLTEARAGFGGCSDSHGGLGGY